MTQKEQLNALTRWKRTYDQLDASFSGVNKWLSCAPESKLYGAAWMAFDNYTDCLERLVGDSGSWLHWYCWENGMGKKRLEAGIGNNMRKIKTIKDLLWVINLK